MKVLGILGGMSWESTLTYYRLLNEHVKQRLGGLHSAKMVLYSVDFAEVEALQQGNQWDEAGALLAEAAYNLEKAGAEGLLIATNTMHKVAGHIAARITVPLLHIADATGELLRAQGLTKVGLLGTAYTMEQDFYKQRLVEGFGLSVCIPQAADRAEVHRIIFEELCRGEMRAASRRCLVRVAEGLGAEGAQGIILGCTELGLLLRQEDVQIPLFDTTRIHALAAVDWALR